MTRASGSPAPHPGLSAALADLLSQTDFEQVVADVLEATELSGEDRESLQSYGAVKVAGLRHLAETMGDEGSEDDLYDSLVTLWIELRSEWERYNKTVAYRAIMFDEHDAPSAAFGAVCSSILARVERLIPYELHRLTRFAAGPQPALSQAASVAWHAWDDAGHWAGRQAELTALIRSSVQDLARSLSRDDPDALRAQVRDFIVEAERRVSDDARPISADVFSVLLEESLRTVAHELGQAVSPSIRRFGVDRVDHRHAERLLDLAPRMLRWIVAGAPPSVDSRSLVVAVSPTASGWRGTMTVATAAVAPGPRAEPPEGVRMLGCEAEPSTTVYTFEITWP